jgi:hypothetical protein
MTGAGMKQISDGSTALYFGNCTMSGKGVYSSSFTRYLVKKLKEFGYDLYSRDEFNTSQMFPELKELLRLEMSRLESSTVLASKSIYIEILWQQRIWQIF